MLADVSPDDGLAGADSTLDALSHVVVMWGDDQHAVVRAEVLKFVTDIVECAVTEHDASR